MTTPTGTADPGESPIVLAFDIGGTSVKAAAIDTSLSPLAETRLPTRQGPAVLDVVVEAAAALREGLDPRDRGRVSAAGVIMPGLVDAERGVCRSAVNLGVADLDVIGPLGDRLGMPVRLAHDVGTGAEAARRAAGDLIDPFVVVLGTGIAAVTYVGGVAVTGASGQAGEVGHVIVRPGGPACRCGALGCLEAVAGAAAIVAAYEGRTGRRLDGARVVVELAATDSDAAAVWGEAVSALADALVQVCALLAPGAILLAGGLSEAGAALTEPVRTLMLERSRVATVPPVLASELGGRAGLVGASQLALEAVA